MCKLPLSGKMEALIRHLQKAQKESSTLPAPKDSCLQIPDIEAQAIAEKWSESHASLALPEDIATLKVEEESILTMLNSNWARSIKTLYQKIEQTRGIYTETQSKRLILEKQVEAMKEGGIALSE